MRRRQPRAAREGLPRGPGGNSSGQRVSGEAPKRSRKVITVVHKGHYGHTEQSSKGARSYALLTWDINLFI